MFIKWTQEQSHAQEKWSDCRGDDQICQSSGQTVHEHANETTECGLVERHSVGWEVEIEIPKWTIKGWTTVLHTSFSVADIDFPSWRIHLWCRRTKLPQQWELASTPNMKLLWMWLPILWTFRTSHLSAGKLPRTQCDYLENSSQNSSNENRNEIQFCCNYTGQKFVVFCQNMRGHWPFDKLANRSLQSMGTFL